MSGESGFTIIPLCVGWLDRDKSQFLAGRGFGQRIHVPVIMFYLEGNGHRLLVDTGCSDEEWANRYHPGVTRGPHEDPVSVLEAVGVAPDNIDTVVLTHLHWDHCWNNGLFSNARFFVQREELRYAAAPLPLHHNGYETTAIGVTPRFVHTNFEVIDGPAELFDGLSVFLMPGHTPGMQGVLVEGYERTYLIAGDNVPGHENLEGDSLHEIVPGGNYVDLEAYYHSLHLMTRLVDKESIIPGHDKAVITHGPYC